jgi:hypothetical protein
VPRIDERSGDANAAQIDEAESPIVFYHNGHVDGHTPEPIAVAFTSARLFMRGLHVPPLDYFIG